MEEFRSSRQSNRGDWAIEISAKSNVYNDNRLYGVQQLPGYNYHASSGKSSISSFSSSSSKSVKSWWNNPEMKRKKRIAKYKLHTVEGTVKASFKDGYRWFKRKCADIVHGL